MSVLEQVLRYKQQRDAEQSLQDSAIPNAINQFVAGQQLAMENKKIELDNQLKQAQANYYNNIVGSLTGNGLATGLLGGLDQTNLNPDDYLVKPELRSLRGIPTVVNAPELKPPVSDKQSTELAGLRRTFENLENNKEQVQSDAEISKRLGPQNVGAYRGLVGDAVLKLQSFLGDEGAGDFATFKAEVDKVFQQFRKETTGAQAALKELGWLAPDFPSASDPKDIFIKKTDEALKRMAEGEKILIDLYGQQGKRVGELRKGSLANTKGVDVSENKIPSYDPKTEKLQQNTKTGAYRVVKK